MVSNEKVIHFYLIDYYYKKECISEFSKTLN